MARLDDVELRGAPVPASSPGLLVANRASVEALAGSTPNFGAEEHWMPALPSIAIASSGASPRATLPFLADQPHGAVYSHDASPAWGFYQKRGDVAPSMPDAGHEVAGIAASKYTLVI
ncbi:MAG: hypothetical protein KF773_37915, partial [Deltaproteobacteria bacterium]|nr:hypothetical protein [Deltaproteobacteria bacterium]